MLDEAKERAKKYQADLKNADADAATAKAALISAGKGEVERLLVEAQERAERMKRDADRLIEQERKQLQHDLLVETVELAVDAGRTSSSRSASRPTTTPARARAPRRARAAAGRAAVHVAAGGAS